MKYSKEQQWLIDNVKEWEVGQIYLIQSNLIAERNYYFAKETSTPEYVRLTCKQWLDGKIDVTEEHTGSSVGYYDVVIPANSHTNPEHNQPKPIVISCNDIIEALKMNYACANVFKAIWRVCASKMGKMKKGNNTVYDAEKAVFFSERVLVQEKSNDQTEKV